MIVQPATEWDVISMETSNSNQIITGYVLPLAGAAAVAAFVGYAFVGFNMFGTRIMGIDCGIYQALYRTEILVYNRDLLRSSSLRNCAVKLAFTFTRSSGVPSNKIIPPPSPPSGPKSII